MDDKIRLEFANLKEIFSGSIELKKVSESLKTQDDKTVITSAEKAELITNIIGKINIMFEGKFGEGDWVIVETP